MALSRAKKRLYFVHPPLGARVVAARAALIDSFEFLQQLALARGEVDRSFNDHVTHQITVGSGAHALDTLTAQPEYFAGLRFGRNLDLDRKSTRLNSSHT